MVPSRRSSMSEAPAGSAAARPGRTRRAGARETILDAIRTAEPLSRVELAAMTGLTEASVSTTVRRLLSEVTGWPVLIENDATAAAVGEFWVARAETARSFAALYMGSGIGGGIVLDGVALRGRRATAGEFGHLCLQVDGPPCRCGGRG